MFTTLWQDESGLTSVEYALMLLLVAVASVTAWTILGQSTTASAAASSQAVR